MIKQRRAEKNQHKTKCKWIRGKQQCDVSNVEQLSRGPTRWRVKSLRESRSLRSRQLRQELEQRSAKNRIEMVLQLNNQIEEICAECSRSE
eukprot:14074420-Ditylum_brightwellii.AAC.1